MSILTQIAPLHAVGRVSIDIRTAMSASTPPRPIPGTPGPASGGGLEQAVGESLTRTLLTGIGTDDGAAAVLEAGLDEYVEVWTPTLHTRSRFELLSSMADLDDAIGGFAVVLTESAASRSVAMIGWQVSARFVRPAFLDDDHLLEPTGGVIRLAGATSIAFSTGGRAERIRCYYDRLALVEQVAAPGHRATTR